MVGQSSLKTYASPQFGDKLLEQLFERVTNYYYLFLVLIPTSFLADRRVQPAAEKAPARKADSGPTREGRPLTLMKPERGQRSALLPGEDTTPNAARGWKPVQKHAAETTPAFTVCGGGPQTLPPPPSPAGTVSDTLQRARRCSGSSNSPGFPGRRLGTGRGA